LRVLHVFKSYYPDTIGGIEQVIAQLGTTLAARGHENRIYTLTPDPHPRVLRRPEGEVHRSRRTMEVASVTLSVPALLEYRAQAAWADIIHYQFPWPFADVLHLLWARDKPSVVTYQSDIVKQKLGAKMYEPVMRCFLRSVSAVVTTSPAYRDSSPVLSRLQRPVTIIPNGIEDLASREPAPASLAGWRERVGEDFFLFVGVLRYYKGLHTLVQAARGFPGRIVIAGNGPEAQPLQRQIAQAGLHNVTMLGQVSDEDKSCLLHLCRGFVFPSHLRSEAFGMSLVEAAMSARPMVSCEIATGTSYINQDGVTGWVVPPEQPDALRAAMLRLHEDAQQAHRMGAAARVRYQALFTARAMAASYEDLYRSLLPAAGAVPAATR
jgi:glycosyltransferase involved in cell wall biosynthesis